jgi:hypothetical protein
MSSQGMLESQIANGAIAKPKNQNHNKNYPLVKRTYLRLLRVLNTRNKRTQN